jgi:uncharacterized protein (DUF2141 family)
MKKICSTLFLMGIHFLNAQTIAVQVNSFENNNGVCFACLFNKAEGFPDSSKNAIKCVKVKIENKIAQFSFKDIPKGDYAISVFHDINNNGKLDENFLGIPKESYGASNNNLPKMSKPKFDVAKFTLTPDKSIIIKLKS